MNDYTNYRVDRMFDKLRKSMKQHANTFVTRYKWCESLSMSQAQEKYINHIIANIPETWIEELNKIYAQIDKKYDRKYIFNIPQEAKKIFTECWDEINGKPSWLIIEK